MKRNVLIAVALAATMTAAAQNIAVVSPSNETSIYQTLNEAITSEETVSGSTIYLPGGGFQISDETKIDKKLTIMGVSHRGDTDNADGATIIAGNLNFIGGSSGSSVLGVYISGNVNVGTAEDAVENLTVKKCNVYSIQVSNAASSGMVVNQCYLRYLSNFGSCNVKLENNVVHSVQNIYGGIICYNIFTSSYAPVYSNETYNIGASKSIIAFNVFLNNGSICTVYYDYYCTDNTYYKNMLRNKDMGDDCINIGNADWNDVFEKYNGGVISVVSKFHFKGDYVQYEKTVGIYGGNTPFSDKTSLAPIPRIISKKVDEQSDANGRLTINVTVKAE